MPKIAETTALVSVGTAAFVAASFYAGYLAGSNRRAVKTAAGKLVIDAQVAKEQDKDISESDSESESEDELADISKLPLNSGDDCKMVCSCQYKSTRFLNQCLH